MEARTSRLSTQSAVAKTVQLLTCVTAVAAVVAADTLFHGTGKLLLAAFAYLCLVLLAAAVWSLRWAVFLSFASAAGFSWLLPPTASFKLSDWREAYALTAFLIVAIIGSYLSRRARTEARRATQSEQELLEVMNAVPAHLWRSSADGAVEFVNTAWQKYTGLPVAQALGWDWESAIHPDDRSRFAGEWKEALASGQAMESEVRVRRADGQYRWWFVRNVPGRDEKGIIVKWYGGGFDIEDRKRAEGLLARENHILEMVAKGEPLVGILNALCLVVEEYDAGALASILLLDGDCLRHCAAPSLPKEYTGAIDGRSIGPCMGSCGTAAYRREQVIVEDITTDPLWADFRELALGHSLRACWSTPILSSQGSVIATFAMYYREPHRPDHSEHEMIRRIAQLAGIAIERKLTQDALRTSEAYLAEAQRVAHLGTWVWKVQGREAVYVSDEWYRIYGFDPELGPPSLRERLKRVHPEDRDKYVSAVDRAIEKQTDYDVEFRIVLPTGATKYLHVIGHPVRNEFGELVNFVGIASDITERKQAEQERERLHHLEADLAHMNRVTTMGELTASLAHEVNQPITAAITNARTCIRWLARETPNIERAREAAARVVEVADRAAKIVSRIRLLFRKGTPERQMIDLNEVVTDIIALVRNEATRHHISIRTELAPGLPAVMGDRIQLQQVVMNLTINSIEAMKDVDGPRELIFRSKLDSGDQLQISVSDTGVGLPPRANEVFTAFFTTKPEGTGMGLAISRSIIESHDGRLWATANAGRGATFCFTLPAGIATSPEQPRPIPVSRQA